MEDEGTRYPLRSARRHLELFWEMTNLDEAGVGITQVGGSIANNTPGDPFLAWAGRAWDFLLQSREVALLVSLSPSRITDRSCSKKKN